MAQALQLWTSAGDCRAEIEARILADPSRAEICQRFSLTEDALAAYERVFFDVGDRLRASSYIQHIVIGSCSPDEHSKRWWVAKLTRISHRVGWVRQWEAG